MMNPSDAGSIPIRYGNQRRGGHLVGAEELAGDGEADEAAGVPAGHVQRLQADSLRAVVAPLRPRRVHPVGPPLPPLPVQIKLRRLRRRVLPPPLHLRDASPRRNRSFHDARHQALLISTDSKTSGVCARPHWHRYHWHRRRTRTDEVALGPSLVTRPFRASPRFGHRARALSD
eukprot:1042513-Prorocentrum_minimum.AAC.1